MVSLPSITFQVYATNQINQKYLKMKPTCLDSNQFPMILVDYFTPAKMNWMKTSHHSAPVPCFLQLRTHSWIPNREHFIRYNILKIEITFLLKEVTLHISKQGAILFWWVCKTKSVSVYHKEAIQTNTVVLINLDSQYLQWIFFNKTYACLHLSLKRHFLTAFNSYIFMR